MNSVGATNERAPATTLHYPFTKLDGCPWRRTSLQNSIARNNFEWTVTTRIVVIMCIQSGGKEYSRQGILQ
jgi:hypothetical protein